MGNLSGESREQNRKDKVTRFRSVTYARQLGLLVNTLGSHLKFGKQLSSRSAAMLHGSGTAAIQTSGFCRAKQNS